MSDRRASWSRREFVGGLSVAGAAGLLGVGADSVAAEPPPETRRIRLVRIPSICRAPQYVADDLLRGQGFTDIEYVGKAGGGASVMALAKGEADISMNYSGPVIVRMDAGEDLSRVGWALMDQTFRVVAGERPVRNERTALRVFDHGNVREVGAPPRVDQGYGNAFVAGYERLWRVTP